METKRVILGANPGLTHLPEIPTICETDKTIHKNELRVILMWPDIRTKAREWIEAAVPQMVIGVDAKKLLHAFWTMPPGSWWEFDCHRKTLSFCYLEKK